MGWKEIKEAAKRKAEEVAKTAKESGGRVRNRVADTAQKAKKIAGNTKDTVVKSATEEGGALNKAGDKLREGFDTATNVAGDLGKQGLEQLKKIDWSKLGEASLATAKQGQELFSQAVTDEQFQTFIDQGGATLEKQNHPIANNLIDEIGGATGQDLTLLKQAVGLATLSQIGIPKAVLGEAMKHADLGNVLSETVSQLLPEGQQNNVEALKKLTGGELAQGILKNPDALNIIKALAQNPKVQDMVKEQAGQLKNQVRPDAGNPDLESSNDSAKYDAAPAAPGGG